MKPRPDSLRHSRGSVAPAAPRTARVKRTSRYRIAAIAAASGAALLLLAIQWSAPGTLDGRSIPEWIAQAASTDAAARASAIDTLSRGGQGVRRRLQRLLHDRPDHWTRPIREFAVRIRILKPRQTTLRARAAAAEALGRIGSVKSVPALARALDDHSFVADSAQEALFQLGPDAIPFIVDILTNATPPAQARTINVLGRFESRAAAAAPVLAHLLITAPDAEVRNQAAGALEPVGVTHPPVIHALARALSDPETSVRRASTKTLASFGSAAAPAMPGLIRALADDDLVVRVRAANALGRTGALAESAVPHLIRNLASSSEMVRLSAALALGRIGPGASEAVNALLVTLGEPHDGIRQQSAIALGRIGPNAHDAIPSLTRALQDESVPVRVAAAEALGKIGPAAAVAVPALIAAWNNDQSGMARAVQFALHSIRSAPQNTPESAD